MQNPSKCRLGALEITLIALGFPIWGSLLIAAFAVVLSLYVSLWSVVVSLWAAEAAVIGGALYGLLAGAFIGLSDSLLNGLLLIGAGLTLAGLSIFLFYGCHAATRGILSLTKKSAIGIKKRLIRKEASV